MFMIVSLITHCYMTLCNFICVVHYLEETGEVLRDENKTLDLNYQKKCIYVFINTEQE